MTRLSGCAAACCLGLLLAGLAGCDRPDASVRYALVSGTVITALPETGELGVEVVDPDAPDADPTLVGCLVTDNSEVYVNDRFAEVEQIELGDRVEIIGQWQHERLVAATVRVVHPLPEPPLPAILTAERWPPPEPSSQPAAPNTEAPTP